jgi:hypothetical protein
MVGSRGVSLCFFFCNCCHFDSSGNTTCGSNYRIDGQGQDSEEIWSPQLAYVGFLVSYHEWEMIYLSREPNEKAEQKLFRRVHIRTVSFVSVSVFCPSICIYTA